MVLAIENYGLEIWDLSDPNFRIIKKQSTLHDYTFCLKSPLELLNKHQDQSKVISIERNFKLKIWNISLEICCFTLKVEYNENISIMKSMIDNLIMIDHKLISEKNDSVLLTLTPIMDTTINLENIKINNQRIMNEKNKEIKSLPLLSGFDALRLFYKLKNKVCAIEDALKNNITLTPFYYNFLHIGAIFKTFKKINRCEFDWSQFEAMKVPIYSFNSEDYQGQTCLQIILKKKDKTLLKHYLVLLFRAFENDFDIEYNNHFYQMLKFYSANFKSGISFFDFLNQVNEIFGEDTQTLNTFFNFMFIEADYNRYTVISDFELEKPCLLISDKFGWLQDKEEVLSKIKNKAEGGICSCLKRTEMNEKKADILCNIFIFKGMTEITEESLDFWENLLKIDPENTIFDNKNLNILVNYKWDSFIRSYYLKDMVGYLIFFVIYLINFIYLSPNRVSGDYLTNAEVVSIILNAADIFYFLIYTYEEMLQGRKLGIIRYFSSFWNLVDVLVFLGVLSTTILDILYIFWEESSPYSIKIIISMTLLFLWARLLSYAKGFEGTGFLIRLVEQVIGDMKFFLIFIFLIMFAFASAGFVLQTSSTESQFSVFNLIYRLMLGDFTNFDEYIQYQESYIPLWIGMILFTIFLSIIMLNLLISIIGETYNKVVAAEKSNRTYEMLSVIYEIEKFKIFGRREYARLKENSIIGDYLVCFHNLSHFQKQTESLETHLKENQEIKEKITEIRSEIQKDANEKFITQNKNFEKLKEKSLMRTLKKLIKKLKKKTTNLKKKLVSLKTKLVFLKRDLGNSKKKLTKH